MSLHADEVTVGLDDARRLVDTQFPQWTTRALTEAGSGTDNQMFRLGEDLLLRLPRRPGTAAQVAKEQVWLPRLGPDLPMEVPAPVGLGDPDEGYPFPWSIYRWLDGDEPSPSTVTDWAAFGRDLAGFVEALHAHDVSGVAPGGALAWYRGQPLSTVADAVSGSLASCRTLEGLDLELDAVEGLWQRLVTTPDPPVPPVWLHGDLRAGNLLVRDGRLAAVLDFGALSLGNPTAEHAAVWELPSEGRWAYRERLAIDDDTWARARGWKLAISLLEIAYYWESWPSFALRGVEQVRTLLVAD